LKIIIENENKKQFRPLKPYTSKHENIFCNNGFVRPYLNEYIKPKGVKEAPIQFNFYHKKNV
jgi:hypothetical protein